MEEATCPTKLDAAPWQESLYHDRHKRNVLSLKYGAMWGWKCAREWSHSIFQRQSFIILIYAGSLNTQNHNKNWKLSEVSCFVCRTLQGKGRGVGDGIRVLIKLLVCIRYIIGIYCIYSFRLFSKTSSQWVRLVLLPRREGHGHFYHKGLDPLKSHQVKLTASNLNLKTMLLLDVSLESDDPSTRIWINTWWGKETRRFTTHKQTQQRLKDEKGFGSHTDLGTGSLPRTDFIYIVSSQGSF